ncbi:hypothetical protein IFM89_032094, partial [Coptis chinensis]
VITSGKKLKRTNTCNTAPAITRNSLNEVCKNRKEVERLQNHNMEGPHKALSWRETEKVQGKEKKTMMICRWNLPEPHRQDAQPADEANQLSLPLLTNSKETSVEALYVMMVMTPARAPIVSGREPTASEDERKLGVEHSKELSGKANQLVTAVLLCRQVKGNGLA